MTERGERGAGPAGARERDAIADDVEALLERDPEGALARLERAPARLRVDPELLYLEGLARWRARGPGDARACLQRAVERDPEFADARHALGDVLGLLGDHRGQVAQWLEVLELDELAAADLSAHLERRPGSLAIRRRISAVAEALLATVPGELRARMGNVSVVLEPRPARGIVEEGFDPRAFGLFEGPDDFQQRAFETPASLSRVVLFYVNLELAFPELERLDEEVEITILHELGHYFGLDEDDVARLGLE